MPESNRPFGSINIGAEMAASMGMDPRPYLTEEQVQEQLRISGMTREAWEAEWDRRVSGKSSKLSNRPKGRG